MSTDEQRRKNREKWHRFDAKRSALDAWAKNAKDNSRKRAKYADLSHSLSMEDIKAMVPADGRCPILGIPLAIVRGRKNSGPNSATVDRRDPHGGYERENCHVISDLANRGKSAMTLEQLVLLGQWAAKTLTEGGK